jgi:thiol-disulfide isomerase/thioredoxin
MKNILFLLFLFTIICITSCSTKGIYGKIDSVNESGDKKLYLLKPNSFGDIAQSYICEIIDSTSIERNGNFHLPLTRLTDKNHLYFLAIQASAEPYKNKLVTDTIGNYVPLIANSASTIKIQIKGLNLLNSYTIIGDIVNKNLKELTIKRLLLYKKYNLSNKTHTEDNLLNIEKNQFLFQKELLNEANKYNDFNLELLALRWASPEQYYERIPELVKSTVRKWESYNGEKFYTQLVSLSNKLPQTIGEKLVDFSLPMMDGTTQPLSSLYGKKLTLVDLWASWCAPCRKENKATLVPVWNSYKDKGLQIIGYSIDADEKSWKNAIIKDGVEGWPNASHMKGDESPFFEKLRISTIPANYLLDSNGVIVAKNLHGIELEKFIEGYLSR